MVPRFWGQQTEDFGVFVSKGQYVWLCSVSVRHAAGHLQLQVPHKTIFWGEIS
jgi:hypothetical protein